ncbi:ankyrin repeat-containing domain protein, partial [Vararia minispora EC-137]
MLSRFLRPSSPYFFQWQVARPEYQNGRHSILYWAAYLGLAAHVQAILKLEGLDIDAQGGVYGNALSAAARHGRHDIVLLLLSSGAGTTTPAPSYYRWTPLHFAAQSAGNVEVVRTLLKHGATVDAHTDDQWTPLHLVAQLGHVEVAHALLEHGATVDACG